MRKNAHLFILVFVVLLFSQCKSTPLGKIQKLVNESTDFSLFFDRDNFEKGRKLMFNSLAPDINNNDSIIILEYYSSMPSEHYSFTIYESENGKTTSYVAKSEIINGYSILTSLRPTSVRDIILPLVLENKFEEILQRGKEANWTPSTMALISILRKNSKGLYEIKTLKTTEFH